MIRWDSEDAQGTKEFGVKEIKLTTEYGGVETRKGSFVRDIYLTEGFFDHLRQHAVPLNENAISQLRDSATALDLYTWLAYRLPRINPKKPASLSWQQLAFHFGNDGANIRKFRQTVRDAWERHVSGVYPEARPISTPPSSACTPRPPRCSANWCPAPHLALVPSDSVKTDDKSTPPSPACPHCPVFR